MGRNRVRRRSTRSALNGGSIASGGKVQSQTGALPTYDATTQFFGRPHLISAGWAILLGIAGYTAGYLDPFSTRTPEVVVKNVDALVRTQPAPVLPTGPVLLGDEAQESLLEIVRQMGSTHALIRQELRALRDEAGRANVDTVDRELALSKALDKLLAAEKQASEVVKSEMPLPQAAPYKELAKILSPAASSSSFKLPLTALGYTVKSSRAFSGLACPSSPRGKGEIRFDFEASSVARFSPLHVTVARIDAPLRQFQVFSGLVDLKEGSNSLELALDLPPAKYQVTLGAYELKKLGGDYPNLFGIQCEILI